MMQSIMQPIMQPIMRGVMDACRSGFSVRSLFAKGQQGAWYDPSDLATLFQDAAGTIPVTGTGQAVGLMLDKRFGLVRGPDVAAPVPGATWTNSGGSFTSVTTSYGSYLALGGVAGVTYEVKLFVSGGVTTQVKPSGTAVALAQGWNTLIFMADTVAPRVQAAVGAVVSEISIRELPGNHATQPTAASRPIFRDVGGLRYLECDGVDDGMVTGSIDFTAADKMFVCAGLRTLSTVTAAVVELSADVGANNGTFLLAAPVDAGNNFRFRAKGTLQRDATSTPTYPPPVSVVAVGQANIPGDTVALRLNGTPDGATAGDLGTGAFGNRPLYLFRRGGTTLPFNGLFYGAIIAGSTYSAAQIASAERYLAGKSGVTL